MVGEVYNPHVLSRAIACSAAACAAGIGALFAQQLPFESYNIDDGLAQSAVVAMAQVPSGFLFFGTQAGLSRFDGLTFSTVDTDSGLPNSLVRCIAVAPDGRLWLGTEDGAAIVDPLSLAVESIPAAAGYSVRAIAFRGDGGAELATWDRGILLVDTNGGGVLRGTADGLPSEALRALLRDRTGRLWIGSWGAGVAIESSGVVRRAAGDGAQRVRVITEDRLGRIWVGADDGLWLEREERLERVPSAAALDAVAITAIHLDSADRLWLATRDRGICRLGANLEDLDCLGVREGLADNSVYGILEDHEGSLWFGTYGGGVSRLSTEGFFNFRGDQGLAHANVYAFAEDPAGRIWVGTNGGGASIWDGATWRNLTSRDGLVHDKVMSMLARHDGSMWVGTLAGLCRINPDRGVQACWDDRSGLPHEIVLALAEDSDDGLWIGTHEGLARTSNGENFRVWTVANGLPDQRINVLRTLRDGRVAIGTGAGVAWYDPATDSLTAEPQLAGLFVTSLYEDEAGAVWVASTDGLARLAGGVVRRWGPDEGMPHRLGSFVIGDGRGGMWIGTGRGIAWFDGQRFSTYSARDGLPSSETNRNAAFRDHSGRLWFGTVQGIAVVRSAGNPLPRRPPRTLVASFSARGEPLPIDGSARIEGGRRDALEIDYVGISLAAGAEVSYELELEGFDPGWRPNRGRTIQYTALPPGHYTFRVRSQIPGSEPSEPAVLGFEIVPAWWQRTSVRTLAVALALGAAIAWGAQLARRNVILEERVRERTRELRDANAELQYIALHDRLTGLANRHAVSFILEREMADRRRSLTREGFTPRATVLLIDLDRFKPINDAWGHAFGDTVLVAVARCLENTVRSTDLVARWGGEEFLVVLRGAARDEVASLTSRLLEAVRKINVIRPDGKLLETSASIGWCDLPDGLDLPAERWEEVLHLADLALYAAKTSGRNRAHGWLWLIGASPAQVDAALAARTEPPVTIAQPVVTLG